MCGIAGFYNPKMLYTKERERWNEILNHMNRIQKHRGPDDEGIYLTDGCGLAHVRLSIIDLSTGHQPMIRKRENRSCAIVYNGEIYNYKEPWTINSFADTLSNYIFKDQKYIEDSKEYYIDERNFMLSELKSINSIHVYDTDTNFILIRLNDKRAKEIKVELLREGNILIRDASNFIGLDDRYIRIAIKSHKENELLIRHMKKLLGD